MIKSVLQKLLACLLVLALLPVNALAENWFSALFGGVNAPQLQFVSVPEKAFSMESARVIAATVDGQKVLISSAVELYLWDTVMKKRVPLTFTQEADLEEFNFRADTAAVTSNMGSLTKEQREKRQQTLQEMKELYLRKHGIEQFTGFDDVFECYGGIVQIGAVAKDIGARYALIDTNYLGLGLLTDMVTGECRLVQDRFAALCGDRLFTAEGITQLDSGETYLPEYRQMSGDGADLASVFNDVCLLKDDSVLVLVPSVEMNMEDRTRNMHLIDVSTERTLDVDLGTFSVPVEPRTLLVTGNGRYVAAYNPAAYYTGQALIIDRENGEAKQISIESLFFVSALEDTFLCYDYKNTYKLVTLDPETMEQTTVNVTGLKTGSIVNVMFASSIVGNGESLYFVQREILHGYLELKNN